MGIRISDVLQSSLLDERGVKRVVSKEGNQGEKGGTVEKTKENAATLQRGKDVRGNGKQGRTEEIGPDLACLEGDLDFLKTAGVSTAKREYEGHRKETTARGSKGAERVGPSSWRLFKRRFTNAC